MIDTSDLGIHTEPLLLADPILTPPILSAGVLEETWDVQQVHGLFMHMTLFWDSV